MESVMSASQGNPFWRVGKPGHGLPRKNGLQIIEEHGGTPAGTRVNPAFPDREWIGYAQQGGGEVPATQNWRFSPKENQDRSMGDSTRKIQ
jgi:hypothetical protein